MTRTSSSCAWTLVAMVCVAMAGRSARAADPPPGTQWVDGDAPCSSGDGSSEQPWCSLEEAFAQLPPPGTHVWLREAAQPYAGLALVDVSGGPGAPLVIEPEPGQAPVLVGSIDIEDGDHWVIRGLRFDGAAGDHGGEPIRIKARDRDVTGIVVEDNTIANWDAGRDGIVLLGTASVDPRIFVRNSFIRRNRVLRSSGQGIRVHAAEDVEIAFNEVAEIGCRMDSLDNIEAAGIVVETASSRIVVAHNLVRDFAVGDCPLGTPGRVAGIQIQGTSAGEARHNFVRSIGTDAPELQVGLGLITFGGVDDWEFHHNLIVGTGGCGLCNGEGGSNGAADGLWRHNTVLDAGTVAYDVQGDAADITNNVVVNNIFARAGRALVEISGGAQDGGNTFDHNLYFAMAGTDVGRFSGAGGDLEAWRGACGCDAASAEGDPQIPAVMDGSQRFTPDPAGPAADLGIDVGDPFVGAAPDAGALEAPRVTGAVVGADRPRVVVLTATEPAVDPLSEVHDCAAFSVLVDGESAPLLRCATVAPMVIELEVVHPIGIGQGVDVEYRGGVIVDGSRIGGRVGATLFPFTIPVDNRSQSEPGAGDSGAGVAPDLPDPDGCGCSQPHRPTPAAAFAAIVLLLPTTRRRRPLAVRRGPA